MNFSRKDYKDRVICVQSLDAILNELKAIKEIAVSVQIPGLIESVDRILLNINDGPIPAQEPVFLLLGRDPLAPLVIRQWAAHLESANGDKSLAANAAGQAERFEAWGDWKKKHMPDGPK